MRAGGVRSRVGRGSARGPSACVGRACVETALRGNRLSPDNRNRPWVDPMRCVWRLRAGELRGMPGALGDRTGRGPPPAPE
eukprot:2363482-Prymnesium_polylepis.1